MASSAVGPARNMTGGVRLPSPIPSLRSIIHFPSSPVPRPYLSGFQLLRAHPRLSKPPVPPLVACCLPRTKGADEEEKEIPAEEGRKQPGMESSQEEEQKYGDGSDGGFGEKLRRGFPAAVKEAMPAKGSAIVAACTIGLLTGVGVVLFNNSVHEIRDLFWDGIPSRGASWLREEPLGGIWQRVILVPVLGGVIVGMLNSLQNILENSSLAIMSSKSKGAIQPVFKAISASITLGTGNSLGPEGPSVEIGASIAKGVGKLLGSEDKGLSLVAAGSAAGISSGFNASVAGCFFAVESVLWPSPADASSSLTNSTSMVILSSVIASVVSEVGLGPVPAFTVPDYDFRSPSELPLYLLLGILCGFVSLTLSSCTSFALEAVNYIQKASGITKSVFPAFGGFAVGLIALAYPEVLYWGFENVDILLESRPFVQGLPADILFQLVGVKIIATSICRASGLVGGYYAPSLFIGAATGVAYGKFMASALSASNALFHLSGLEVASPQAYGLVGMAATLAGVCQVPLTSVLLLFELTQDYRIVLPLLGAVGLSSWITSQNRKISVDDKMDSKKSKFAAARPPSYSSDADNDLASSTSTEAQQTSDLCEIESSLCLYESYAKSLEEKLTISHAMRTRYVTVFLTTSLNEAVTLMLKEKQSCAVIVDNGNLLVGLLTLRNLERFCREPGIIDKQVDKLLVSDLCNLDGYKCQARSITPETTLYSARKIMDLHGIEELPVISESTQGRPAGYLIGLLDRESIDIACRASAAKALLSLYEKEP